MSLSQQELLKRASDQYHQLGHIDIVRLILDLGINIELKDEEDNFNAEIMHSLDDSSFTIYLNQNHSLVRQRFSLAHELAHYVLHNDEIITQKSLQKGNKNHLTKEQLEIERHADELAAEILMPYEVVNKYMDSSYPEINKLNKQIVKNVADRFKVSWQVAIQRLRVLDYYIPFIEMP